MKKGQAAMEFLMTDGWAILVVLLAIIALAYFGVLNPGRYMPSSCILEPGLGCIDFKVDGETDEIILVIRNGMGTDLNPFEVYIGGKCDGSDEIETSGGFIDGAEEALVIDCGEIISGSKFKEDIKISYTSSSNVSHVKTGSISAKIE